MHSQELSLPQLMTRFATEEAALAFMETVRWPHGVVCPHCGNDDQAKFWKRTPSKETKVRAGLRECAVCHKQFRVTVGTIFEDSHIPLNLWLVAWYIMAGAKKGISAKQMQRHLGLGSYKSAWFLCHRIRHALTELGPAGLSGTVEADEGVFGAKGKNVPGGMLPKKTYVVALVERPTGRRRSVQIDRLTAVNVHQAVREHVAAGSTLNTDKGPNFTGLRLDYKHKTVLHEKRRGKREFARREANSELVSTQYVESSFSLLRRGIAGNFHHISKHHLGLYLAEFDHRWNCRKLTDSDRTIDGLKKAEGKRLTYKSLPKRD